MCEHYDSFRVHSKYDGDHQLLTGERPLWPMSRKPAPLPCPVHDVTSSIKTSVVKHSSARTSSASTAKTATGGRSKPAPAPPAATVSDSVQSNQAYEEYIHNLQQQVYFLELESQMLKHRPQTSSGGGFGTSAEDDDGSTAGTFDEIFTQVSWALAFACEGFLRNGRNCCLQFKRRHAATEKEFKTEIDAQRRTIESLRGQVSVAVFCL